MTKEQKFSDALAVQVERRIFLVRGQKVMLDADLAMLYGVEPRGLNQAVARKRKRFPADFVFQLSAREYDALTSQIVISDKDDAGRFSFEITNCDLKERPWRPPLSSIRLYRAGRRHALKSSRIQTLTSFANSTL